MEIIKEGVTMITDKAYKNTDREIWRESIGGYYNNSIHVTEQGAIGINCGSHVIVAPVEKWHEAGNLLFCVDDKLPFFSIRRKLALWLLKGINRKTSKG